MKDNKIIKDLKERNDKLKMQYDFNNIHLISLENKYANLQTENTKLKQEKEEQTKTYQKILQEQQNEIDIANKKLDKIKKYVTEKLIYIDNCDDQETILSIIGGE